MTETEAGFEVSLHTLLVQAERLGSDRLSLHCFPTDATPAGLCIVLIGRDAIKDISQLLIDTAKRVGEVKPDDRLVIKLEDSAHFMLQWLVENGIPWSFTVFEFRDQPVMVFSFAGSVCYDLAEPLTRLGCPTEFPNIVPFPVVAPS